MTITSTSKGNKAVAIILDMYSRYVLSLAVTNSSVHVEYEVQPEEVSAVLTCDRSAQLDSAFSKSLEHVHCTSLLGCWSAEHANSWHMVTQARKFTLQLSIDMCMTTMLSMLCSLCCLYCSMLLSMSLHRRHRQTCSCLVEPFKARLLSRIGKAA